jgi:hypothetical protein
MGSIILRIRSYDEPTLLFTSKIERSMHYESRILTRSVQIKSMVMMSLVILPHKAG